MGKSTPSPPAAPDPSKVSAAQTQSNKDTALYNFGLNNPSVNTPLGSSTYTISNSSPSYNTDAYNKAVQAWQATSAPHYNSTGQLLRGPANRSPMPTLEQFKIDGGNPQVTQNIQLSPDQQQLYNQQTQQSIDLGKLASSLQGRVGDALNQPTTSYADLQDAAKKAQDAYYTQQTAYLDPQYGKEQEMLDNQLANQGILRGSEAYNQAEDEQNRKRTFAYNQAQQNAILQGPQNAQALFGLQTAARDQPLTEFNALRTGAQPQMPQFGPTQPSSAQPTNVAGNIWNAFGAQQDAYNQQVAGNNAATGGLFGLAGNLGSAALLRYGLPALAASDIRLKENITHLGYERGLPTYSFSYRNDPRKTLYRGVMAQDVMLTRPDAVIHDGEYFAVNYGMLGIEFGRIQ